MARLNQLQFGYAKAQLAVSIVFGSLALLAVALRFHARRLVRAKLGYDDHVIVISLVLCLGLCIMSAWAAVNGGLGVPQKDLTPELAVTFLKQTWSQEIISTPAIGLVKVSVCLFYKRVFSINKTFKLCANVMMVAAICWSIAFTCTLAFSLWPVDLHWSLGPERNEKHTLDFAVMIIAMAATDVALDLITLSMPVPMIRKLHLPPKKKWMLVGMFGLGAFCVIASLVRLSFIVKFLNVYGVNDAFSRDENQIALWSNIEPCASVICACLPTYGPFVSSSSSRQKNNSSDNNSNSNNTWLHKNLSSLWRALASSRRGSSSTSSLFVTEKSSLGNKRAFSSVDSCALRHEVRDVEDSSSLSTLERGP